MTDISTIDDIRLLVHIFYDEVRKDATIGPIFIGAVRDRWPEHLENMVRFWQTIILGDQAYTGNPFPLHMRMPRPEPGRHVPLQAQ